MGTRGSYYASHGFRLAATLTVVFAASASDGSRPTAAAGQASSAPAADRIDYLTLGQGAVPIAVGGAGAAIGASFEMAISAIDGNPGDFSLFRKPGDASTDTEFVYQLPAPTVFDRFAVPTVLETPGPSQTFTKDVEVHGSAAGPAEGYVLLGSATLATHKGRGEVTELAIRSRTPVRWVKLRLAGGIQNLRPQMYFEFSEIIGNGTQQTPAMADHFRGVWKGRGVSIALGQDGPLVSGCYDADGVLSGTVSGNILRALGVGRRDRVESAFILAVADDGTLRGVRSTNRAPFVLYTGGPAPAGSAPTCPSPPPAALGCGSIIHGIAFDFDSAVIREDSGPVLAKLYEGLRSDPSGAIVIEGHTSSEGSDDYNLRLSERRAQTVVADLVKRGIDRARLTAAGIGEKQPIASNNDESGRSINRRVEVRCR
jgi:outer membrane protein OmpA-like peptidoglycan-associated protein